MKINRDFFEKKPDVVAKELLGMLLVRKIRDKYIIGEIVETEAYLGDSDKASHAHKGKTKRNEPMFGLAGLTYIYFTYGIHWLLNVVTQKEGVPSAVLIRAVKPIYDKEYNLDEMKLADLRKLGSGPARLTKWMKIDGKLNKLDIVKKDKLFITDEIKVDKVSYRRKALNNYQIIRTKRIGVDYAGEHKDLLLRFYIKDSEYASRD